MAAGKPVALDHVATLATLAAMSRQTAVAPNWSVYKLIVLDTPTFQSAPPFFTPELQQAAAIGSLLKLGLRTGKPTKTAPGSGEKLILANEN